MTAGGVVTQIALTLSSGTAPASWPAHPAGTWYLGAWSSGVDALSGFARSLALWNVALSVSDISALGSINPQIQNVVWARAINTGSLAASTSRDNISLTGDVHPKAGFTPSIVSSRHARHLWRERPSADLAAGGTPGPDTAALTRSPGAVSTVRRGGLTPKSRVALAMADLPFFGQHYGVGVRRRNAANPKPCPQRCRETASSSMPIGRASSPAYSCIGAITPAAMQLARAAPARCRSATPIRSPGCHHHRVARMPSHRQQPRLSESANGWKI